MRFISILLCLPLLTSTVRARDISPKAAAATQAPEKFLDNSVVKQTPPPGGPWLAGGIAFAVTTLVLVWALHNK